MVTPTLSDIWNAQGRIEERLEHYWASSERDRATMVTLAQEMKDLAASINKARGAIWVGWALGGAFISIITAVTGYIVKVQDSRIARLEAITRTLPAPTRTEL